MNAYDQNRMIFTPASRRPVRSALLALATFAAFAALGVLLALRG